METMVSSRPKPLVRLLLLGVALGVVLGLPTPAAALEQTDADEQTVASDEALASEGLPEPSGYDKADFFDDGAGEEDGDASLLSVTTSLSPMYLSDEMKYFAKYESNCNYDQGFSYGDSYNALGYYQFDRRYGLVDFMSACLSYDSSAYSMFSAVVARGDEVKSGTIYDSSSRSLTELGSLIESAWHQAYAQNPSEFAALQDAWAWSEYYEPTEQWFSEQGMDISGRADCVKGLVWGASNLFGPTGARWFFTGAGLSASMTDEQFVTSLCDYIVNNVATRYSSQSQYWEGWQNRYRQEKAECLEYLANSDPDGQSLSSLGSLVTNLEEGSYYLLSSLGASADSAYGAVCLSSTSIGAQATLTSFAASSSQLFELSVSSSGQYCVKAASGYLLDASGPSWASGTPVIQWASNGGENQLWQLWMDSAGWVYVSSVYAGDHNRVLTVSSSDEGGMALELQAAASGSSAQRFRLVAASDYRAGLEGWQGRYWYDSGVRAEGKEFYDPTTNAWYWADSDGTIARDKDVWMPEAKKWVRYDSRGQMIKGEDCRYGGWYYFDEITGAMAHGVTLITSSESKWVCYDPITGKMLYGLQQLSYDSEHKGWYYFDTITGAMAHGTTWVPELGAWRSFDAVTGKMA